MRRSMLARLSIRLFHRREVKVCPGGWPSGGGIGKEKKPEEES